MNIFRCVEGNSTSVCCQAQSRGTKYVKRLVESFSFRLKPDTWPIWNVALGGRNGGGKG